ncbi:GNAT family protein [Streptomyces sp. RFCAC02]|uniref:GNAT family N-acetyltransferase n=1 Tax=Streptomyces sp. RFCAC02 TaxID=2499143 RepID=UPI0010227C9F|nr:GNAT family protein [Streptomyces sp. RFCAC02]
MEIVHWPLYALRLRTPRLELRLPGPAELDELAAVAAAGVHDPERMPFSIAWTDAEPRERGRATFQHVLGTIGDWRPERWTLSLAVSCDGRVVGRQDISAHDFAVTREATTGSWLGLAHQGNGLGTEMRAAITHLAFECLGARAVTSAAMLDNPASLRVSEKLGYRPDGIEVISVRGAARTLRRLRLDRADWTAHRTVPVEVGGLDGCRGLFGL